MKPQKLTQSFQFLFLCMLLAAGVAPIQAQQTEPAAMILTWQQDPTTTMTIDWHTQPGDDAISTIYYKPLGDVDWLETVASEHDFPDTDRTIHRVELTELAPGSLYRFRVGEFTREYKFETMPAELDRPIRMAVGGDVMEEKEWMARTNRLAMTYEPDFIMWGGDLAYADARPTRVHRWFDFLDAMMETLITEEGKVIPVIVSIGNHELQNRYIYNYDDYEERGHTDEWRMEVAPYFFSLWAFPGLPGYNLLDFGDYLSLLILDSLHANDTGGEQNAWLRQSLEDRRNVPHVFPLYHVAGWASVKGTEYRTEQIAIHEDFYPVFDEFNLRVVFEKHDHAYKRTPPMRGGEVVAQGEGVVYLGDGAWGVDTRDHIRHLDESRFRPESVRFGHYEIRQDGIIDDIEDIWYLETFAPVRHFILATIYEDDQHFLMIDENGNIIDEYTEDDYYPSFDYVGEN